MNGLGDDFAVRLRQLRQATEAEGKQAEGQKSQSDKRAVPNGLGLAARITTELVAAVLVGALLGWWLDGVFGTSPWLLLVFLLLGFAAALRNIVRVASQAEQGAKRSREQGTEQSTEQSTGQSTERSTGQSTEQATGQSTKPDTRNELHPQEQPEAQREEKRIE